MEGTPTTGLQPSGSEEDRHRRILRRRLGAAVVAAVAFLAVVLPLSLRGGGQPAAALSGSVPVAGVSVDTAVRELPRPTATKPMHTYFDGDSVAGIPALEFAKLTTSDAVVRGRIKPTTHYHVGARLADPQMIWKYPPYSKTWVAHVRAVMTPSRHIDAVVFMIGANDPGMPVGTAREFWSSAWKLAYRARVGKLMDAMLAAGAKRVYWVGMPIMKPGTYPSSDQMRRINDAFLREAQERPGRVKYLSTWKLLSTSSGAFDPQWRGGDGVHLNTAGGQRVARFVMRAVKADWLPPL